MIALKKLVKISENITLNNKISQKARYLSFINKELTVTKVSTS